MGAFVAPIIAGLSAITGMFGSKKTTSDSTNTTTPNYDPASLNLKNFLLGQYQSSVDNIPAWNKAYETTGLRNILNNASGTQGAAEDALAARGISRTTAGANALTDTSYSTGKTLSDFMNQTPLTEQQNLLSTLGGAGSFLASLPVGSTSTAHTVSTGNAPVNPVQGALFGGAQGLAGVLGQQSAQNSLAKILKGLNIGGGSGSSLASIPTAPSVSSEDDGSWQS